MCSVTLLLRHNINFHKKGLVIIYKMRVKSLNLPLLETTNQVVPYPRKHVKQKKSF